MLSIDNYILDLAPYNEDLRSRAKRYTTGTRLRVASQSAERPLPSSTTGFTLILAHGLGGIQEFWEPTIAHLFDLERRARRTRAQLPTIAEVWTIEIPDHGESASLNDDKLRVRTARVSCHVFGKAVLALVHSGLLSDTKQSKPILVGHCGGATSWVLSTKLFPSPSLLPFSAVILVEPWMIHADLYATSPEVRAQVAELVRSSLHRRDIWATREEAHSYLKSKSTWKAWDPRVLDLYVKHGLRSLPTHTYPDKNSGVTLSHARRSESNTYEDLLEGQAALDQLVRICKYTPVHAIFGETQPPGIMQMQRKILEVVQPITSVSYLPNTGHKVVQESPEPLAGAIWGVLMHLSRHSSSGRISQEIQKL